MSKRRENRKRLKSYIGDLTSRQKNLIWPDILRVGRSVDEYLWKGDRKAPLVQRIGAFLFALCYLAVGLFVLGMTGGWRYWPFDAIAILYVMVGVKVWLSAAKR